MYFCATFPSLINKAVVMHFLSLHLLHCCTIVPVYCCTGGCCRGSNLILFSPWPGGDAAAAGWRGGGASGAAVAGWRGGGAAATGAVAAVATVDADMCKGEITAPLVVTSWRLL